jgi:hypothetical protein
VRARGFGIISAPLKATQEISVDLRCPETLG